MTAAVAAANIVLGIAYTSYGIITAIDMKRGWRTMGFSHFGAAWIFMAFTCGPHHLEHGLHLALAGRVGGPLDLAAVAIGLPFGVIWLLLRLEALSGGRGDRFISGTPWYLAIGPMVAAVYVTALGAAALTLLRTSEVGFARTAVPNLLLLGLYAAIGAVLFKTQFENRPIEGGWSVSGLSLGVVFPTCGLMHTVHATYMSTGLYEYEWHGFTIDWLAVPAAAYFLWVVWALYRGTLSDWNRAADRAPQPIVAGRA
ncbi:MAG TPA: hypothetical protein VGB83_06070 [Actinomycetota bacterium]